METSGKFWSLVRESLRGSRPDLTQIPLGRAILLLAVPMVLEMGMESIFAVADIFWVSKLGPDATASVGLTESLMVIVYALAMGLCMGGAAVVARRIGQKDPEGAARAAVQLIFLGIVLSVVMGLAGVTLAPQLLRLMGAAPETIAVGGRFTAVMLGGCMTVVLLFMINAAFRGAGDAPHLRQRRGAVADRHRQLGRSGEDPVGIRERGAGGLHHHRPRRAVRHSSLLGNVQRRGDFGRSKPGRAPAPAGGERGLARRRVQLRILGRYRGAVLDLRATPGRGVLTGPAT